jgi:hypothetical protein
MNKAAARQEAASLRTNGYSECILTSSRERRARLLRFVPDALISEWVDDGSGHPSPIRTTLSGFIDNYATYNDVADAIQRTYLDDIPANVDGLRKVTGRGNKAVHRGGPTPFNALAYA